MNEHDALSALAALGQETRLAIFRLLVKAGDEGLAAGDVAHQLGVLQNTLSSHLKILSQAGLVTQEREGRVIRYRAGFLAMRDLLAFLMEDCCNGNPELCSPVIEAVTCGCN
ncbi:MAG: helix-turn-helix transcriptional regulator [Notoacmeibacter sp.]|nr:helix-turn-helix transcriptional regulator [Notoacmeibacter sp.]